MNETLALLLEALEGADRKALDEIALDEFEVDHSKSKMRKDDLRDELIALANKKYGDPEAVAPVAAAADDEPTTPEAPEKPKVRVLKHKKTGRIITWTEALAKRSGLVEVD